MYVLNAGIESVQTGYDGIKYFFAPNEIKTMTAPVAEWVTKESKKLGLVVVDDVLGKGKKDEAKKHVARRMLEGLAAYVETVIGRLDAYQRLDQEIKQGNGNGTCLNSPECRREQDRVKLATEMMAKIEEKHGVSIRREDLTQKTIDALSTIDSLIDSYEKDTERQIKANAEQRAAQQLLDEAIAAVLPARK